MKALDKQMRIATNKGIGNTKKAEPNPMIKKLYCGRKKKQFRQDKGGHYLHFVGRFSKIKTGDSGRNTWN